MRRDIDIALLRAFVAVVETGSVTGAANLLNLTQAAVSQQVKRLEEVFGTELFERHHKRLVLKPNGERLMAHAQRMIALNDEVWGAMSAPAYEGEVRLGVPHDIVGTYLPPILRRFDKAWPRARVAQVHHHAEPAGAAAAGQHRSDAHHRGALRAQRRDADRGPAGVDRSHQWPARIDAIRCRSRSVMKSASSAARC
jgi:DNA-binding transcriptional LysR family regulator